MQRPMTKKLDQYVDLEKLVTAIREIVGDDALDRVIMHGSYIIGNWNPETSDIDVTVLLRPVGLDRKRAIEGHLADLTERDDLGPLASRLAVVAIRASHPESLRAFPLCAESKMLERGVVIAEGPDRVVYEHLPRQEAKNWVMGRGIATAGRILDPQRWKVVSDELDAAETCADAHTAACMCLRALLYFHEIDPSSKEMRWKVGKLLERLIEAMPAATRLSGVEAVLPDHHYHLLPRTPATVQQARAALAAAIRLHRLAYRTVQINDLGDLTPASYFRRRRTTTEITA